CDDHAPLASRVWKVPTSKSRPPRRLLTTESLIPLSSCALSCAFFSLSSIFSACAYKRERLASNLRADELALDLDPRERFSSAPSRNISSTLDKPPERLDVTESLIDPRRKSLRKSACNLRTASRRSRASFRSSSSAFLASADLPPSTPPLAIGITPGMRLNVSARIFHDRRDPSRGMNASSTSMRSPTTRHVFGATI